MPAPESKSETRKTSDAQKAVSEYDGWQILHEQEPRAVTATGPAGTVSVVHPSRYVAGKREGLGVHEISNETLEGLKKDIEEWERQRPSTTVQQPTEEQLMAAAKGRLTQLMTSGARPALDVDLTPAAEAPKPKAKILSVKPAVDEEDHTDESAAALNALGTPGT